MPPSDPFGTRSHVSNSAIHKHHTLAPDIYKRLFDTVFFKSQVFTTWSQGDRSWSLHCYGDPGCGKTTLAAIAVQRLREMTSASKNVPVVSIFIEEDISTSAGVFLEDFLYCVHQQLLPSAGSETDSHFRRYETASRSGESISKRTRILRTALYSQLDAKQHTLLVLDGYDRLGESLQILLDRELEDLQKHRLRILLTTRVPTFELPLDTNCDGGPDCHAWDLKLFWACTVCSQDPDEAFALCYDCKAKGKSCPHHGTAYLKEDYDHVNISFPDDLREFVEWDIQRCFGIPAAQPAPDSDTAIDFIADIGNITIAKLYLDNVHKDRSLDVVHKPGDRLPRNVVALFDAGIERIKKQPKHEADISLMAIAAAADRDNGTSIVSLEDWMRDALSRLPYLARAPPRSLEDILRCANGYIFEDSIDPDDRVSVEHSSSFKINDRHISYTTKADIAAHGNVASQYGR
ncbi:hypothetical protein CC86DRAFT_390868 [Ophiobolus disseminans]|uniref:Nephrocystin 3-like N-terminal domain-containing protein n=1 Tax=Ophiobolus disseminans TaxID=1469910 RepID=A0A6A7AF61_9PLEO|nr:hypothetical protein CC86DRAFT_390868 [Ophiobolus disseminans]